MTKKADTWMPLYVGEYLADTTNLNTEQHGAYCLMLMAAWKRGGRLPDDDQQLASITKMSPAKWRANRGVLAEFFQIEGGTLRHKRVTEEREKAQSISDKKALTGKAGADKRWQKDGKPDGEGDGKPIAKAMANAMANASQTDAPSPSPLPVPSEHGEEAAAAALSPAAPPPPPSPPIPPAPPPSGDLLGDATEMPESFPCPVKQLVVLFATKVPEMPRPRIEMWRESAGADAMRARWKWLLSSDAVREDGTRYAETPEEAIDWFSRFFDTVEASDFLTGRKSGGAKFDLAWLMKRENFMKVVQGNYANRERAHA